MPLGRLRQGGSCASTAAAAALALLLCGCAVEGLAFRSDDRVDVVAPDDLTEVTLPFTVQWTARDVRGRFGVFVDRTPQPPGKTLDWFARDDDECERVPGCPDKAYFAERRIFTTDERSFTVEAVKPTSRNDERCHTHEVTLVLLDEDGRRKGESAWSREVRLCRKVR
jgi:hypothetical protein